MSNFTSRPLYHLVRQPERKEPGRKPPLLLLLHGIGSNERDLFALAPYLDPRFLVLSLRAPNTLGPDSYAWFEVEPSADRRNINEQQAEASRQALLRFIPQAVSDYAANGERVYLMGFSQGAIMSASVLLTEPDLVAGAVLMSGRILPEIRPHMAEPEQLAGLPVLVIHGTRDQVLPVTHGRASRDTLSALPISLTYLEYNMRHEVTDQSLATAAAWLTRQLNSPRRAASE